MQVSYLGSLKCLSTSLVKRAVPKGEQGFGGRRNRIYSLREGEWNRTQNGGMGFKPKPPTSVKGTLLYFSRQTGGREVLVPGSWRSDSL